MEERMMRQLLLFIFLLLVCSVSAEQFKITGKVVDEHNEPFIGATVWIKATDHHTATDMDGNFRIEVEKGTILKFSYIGCTSKEVEVLNDSSLVIELEEDPDALIDFINWGNWGYSLPWRPTVSFKPIERDSLKTNPKNQNNMINH